MPVVNITALQTRLENFLRTYNQEIYEVAKQATHVFEAVCYVLFLKYYKAQGYFLVPKNPIDNKFRFRYSTAGHPWNYSYFAVFLDNSQEEDKRIFEVRHNQKVISAWAEIDPNTMASGDDSLPLFAADIVVIKPHCLPELLPNTKRDNERCWVLAEDLITFAEVKKLKGYPMLIAQFFGIVHEMTPCFAGRNDKTVPEEFNKYNHIPPTLFTSEHLTKGTRNIVRSLKERGVQIRVVYDVNGDTTEERLLRLLDGIDGD